MNSIQNQAMASAMPNKYSSPSDAQVASYMRRQSVTATQSLSAGLTIQTREGDVVTLTSNSYAKLDASMYNSKGVLQNADGMVAASVNQREITLATGESFTFSVVGDLSEEELDDIEDIVKGIDEIISEMAQGDMEEAVEKAMGMGNYDTVSMYAADITYQRNVEATVETRAQAAAIETQAQAAVTEKTPPPEILPKENAELMSHIKPYPENRAPRKSRKNSIKDINRFVEKMTEKLEKHSEKAVKRSEKAIDKLFNHHMKKGRDSGRAEANYFNTMEKAHAKLTNYIDKMFNKLFDAQMSLF